MTESKKKRTAEQQIDENLKRVYGAVESEELPDRFKDLLAQLKQKGTTSNDDSGSGTPE